MNTKYCRISDNIYGNIFVIVLLNVFLNNKPKLYIWFSSSHIFIKRYEEITRYAQKLPSEEEDSRFARHNSFPVTLEEEVYSNAPLVNLQLVNVNFKPVSNVPRCYCSLNTIIE